MTEKLPKPLISMRFPRTIALLNASKMVATAVSASPCANLLEPFGKKLHEV